jgi:hypothetical protein
MVDAMVPEVKATLKRLMPADLNLAKKVFGFLWSARYCPKYRAEFTAIAKFLFCNATGTDLETYLTLVDTNNISERIIQAIIACLERRRQPGVSQLLTKMTGVNPKGERDTYSESVGDQMVDRHHDDGRSKTELSR